MRKRVAVFCIISICLLLAGPGSFAAGTDRGETLRSRAGTGDSLMLWRSHSRLQREFARLLIALPFTIPADPIDRDGGPIRGGLGLSDDPDPTGARGDNDDEQGGSGPDGDQERPSGEDSAVTQLGRR